MVYNKSILDPAVINNTISVIIFTLFFLSYLVNDNVFVTVQYKQVFHPFELFMLKVDSSNGTYSYLSAVIQVNYLYLQNIF